MEADNHPRRVALANMYQKLVFNNFATEQQGSYMHLRTYRGPCRQCTCCTDSPRVGITQNIVRDYGEPVTADQLQDEPKKVPITDEQWTRSYAIFKVFDSGLPAGGRQQRPRESMAHSTCDSNKRKATDPAESKCPLIRFLKCFKRETLLAICNAAHILSVDTSAGEKPINKSTKKPTLVEGAAQAIRENIPAASSVLHIEDIRAHVKSVGIQKLCTAQSKSHILGCVLECAEYFRQHGANALPAVLTGIELGVLL